MTETYSRVGPQCPYCGFQYTADEPIYYDEMGYTEETCSECRKKFNVSVCTDTTWTCTPVGDE